MDGQPISPVPDGYNTVNPWVIPKGAAKFIQFLEEVFAATENKEARTPDRDGLLIHAEVRIGESVILIFDSKDTWPATPSFLQVYVDDAAAVLDRALKAGAVVVTELSDFVYGEKLARFKDPWGNLWWIHQRTEEVDWEAEAARLEEERKETTETESMDHVYETLMQAMKEIGNSPKER